MTAEHRDAASPGGQRRIGTRRPRRPQRAGRAGALKAVAAADVVIFVVDGRAGVSAADAEALALIREVGRPILLAVNKLDTPALETRPRRSSIRLGVEHLFMVSASHGRGVEELLDAVIGFAAARSRETAPPPPDLRIALIGRPNVGKSSLLNRLVGAQRSIVDATPGTTRDPVDVRIKSGDQELIVVDTAGIRRPTRVEGRARASFGTARHRDHPPGRSAAAGGRRREGITDQDVRLAHLVESEDRALIVICNKWDVAARAGRKQAAFTRDAHERYSFLEFAPLIYTSAMHRRRLARGAARGAQGRGQLPRRFSDRTSQPDS